MVGTLNSRWPVGEERSFGLFTANLVLFCKRIEPKIASKFLTTVHNFNINLRQEASRELFLPIGQIDFSKLRDCIRNVFDQVIGSYADKSKLICQVNMSFPNLKKKFLKTAQYFSIL